MAQRVFWNHQEALKSFDFGKMMAGLFFPGRYTGFDTKSFSSMVLSLTHAATGIQQSDINGSLTNKTGVWISPQGAVIQESATVSIGTVASNSSGNPRIDLIIGDYLKPVSSTASATYALVTGTPGATPAAPANPDTTRKVILGYLLVPDGTTTDLTSCTFTKADIPLIGGEARAVYHTESDYTLDNSWTSSDAVDDSKVTIRINAGPVPSFQFMEVLKSPGGSNVPSFVTLPTNLRPVEDMWFPVTCTDPGGGIRFLAAMHIRSTGECMIDVPHNTSDPGDGSTPVWLYLHNLIIPIVQ